MKAGLCKANYLRLGSCSTAQIFNLEKRQRLPHTFHGKLDFDPAA